MLFKIAWGVCLAGCNSSNRSSTTGTNQPLVSTQLNPYVIVDLPKVVIENGETSISGTVRRKPGIRWLLAGRIDIEFISDKGELLDFLPALITPKTISMDPNTPSVYSTSYGYVAPPGSTIIVHFVDSDTQAREDLDGADFYGNAPGGAPNGAPAAGKGGGKANHQGGYTGHGHGHGGGFGGGFGSH